jgi:integrase/recombinase XerD
MQRQLRASAPGTSPPNNASFTLPTLFSTKNAHQFMLEHWYKEKRTFVDFRRGPLGPHFDGFAADLKAKRYSYDFGKSVLGKCCQFNWFLIERGIVNAKEIRGPLIDSFLQAYYAPPRTAGPKYSPQGDTRLALKHLFAYLAKANVWRPPKPEPVTTAYAWLLNPYLRYLQVERELSPRRIAYEYRVLDVFLRCLGQLVSRERLKIIKAETIEGIINDHFKNSSVDPGAVASVLRQFFHYCVKRRFTQMDFAGLVPTVRRYRHASLPKGMEDSALERMLKAVKRNTPFGARDYAILMVMMAYGIRAISVAQLVLEDIDWHHSRIRIRAQKGGKEVVVPLLEPVGEALIECLRHRPSDRPFREVFLGLKAPFQPLSGMAIARVVAHHMKKAGGKTPGSGVRTLRHSWANLIRIGCDHKIIDWANAPGVLQVQKLYLDLVCELAAADLLWE